MNLRQFLGELGSKLIASLDYDRSLVRNSIDDATKKPVVPPSRKDLWHVKQQAARIPKHRRWIAASHFITEVLRTAAVACRGPLPYQNGLVDWALKVAGEAARSRLDFGTGDTLDFPERKLLTISGANAMFEVLVYADRRREAASFLEAMRASSGPYDAVCTSAPGEEESSSSLRDDDLLRENHDAHHRRKTVPPRYPAPNSYTFNVLLRDLARRKAHPDDAENVITAMCNDGLKPDSDTVFSVLSLHRKHGDAAAAVTAVQDLYNQFRVRPDPATFVYFIAGLLSEGDHHEARRAVAVLEQLWPKDERSQTRAAGMLSDTELAALFDHFGAPN